MDLYNAQLVTERAQLKSMENTSLRVDNKLRKSYHISPARSNRSIYIRRHISTSGRPNAQLVAKRAQLKF